MRLSHRTAGAVRGPGRLIAMAAVLAGLVAVSSAAADGVYKWVDEQGKVHYGDRPPADAAANQVEIEDRPAPSGDDAARREKARRLLNAIETERAQNKAAAAREQARSARRERNCAIAKRRVDILQRANSVSITGDDGQRRYLDDEERAAALVRARKLVQDWC